MSWYLAAALVLQVALIPCAWVCWRSGPEHRVVALGLAGTVQALAFLYLSMQAGDVALSQIVVGAIAVPLIVLLSLAKVRKGRE